MGFINKMVTPNKIGQPDTGLDQKEEKEAKNDDEEYNPMAYFDRIEKDANRKRDTLRGELKKWKKTIDLDEIASVDPIVRAEKMRDLAKTMLLKGIV